MRHDYERHTMKKYSPIIVSIGVLIVTVLIGLITNLITNNPPVWLQTLSSPILLVALVILAAGLVIIQIRSQNGVPATQTGNRNQSSESHEYQLPSRRYRIGNISANVFMDLMGGGDFSFDCNNLNFEYEHVVEPLPESIEARRDSRLKQLESDARERGHVFFNGPAIRLHSFSLNIIQAPNGREEKNPILFFRPTSWYDYALSNRNLEEKVLIAERNVVTTIRDEYADESKLVTTRTIQWIKLTNILTVTVIMVSQDGKILLGRRTDRVDNSRGVFVASAAENMHRWKDEPSDPSDQWSLPKGIADVGDNVTWDYRPFSCPNPFFTVLRGLREELAAEIADSVAIEDIKFLSLAWNLTHFQPHLIAYVPVKMSMQEIENILDSSRGEDNWEANVIPVAFEPSGKLKEFLKNYEFADISKAAILRSLVHIYGYEAVNKGLG